MKDRVRDYMRKKYEVVDVNDPLDKVITTLSKIPYSEVPVADGKRIVGEVRQRDLLRLAIAPKNVSTEEVLGPLGIKTALMGYAKTAKDVMVKHTISVRPNDSVDEIARLMLAEEVRAIPVIDKGKVVGLIAELDVLRYVKDNFGKK